MDFRAYDDEVLLSAYKTLTHQIHATRSSRRENAFREQRDLLEAEILRRMAR